MFDFHMHSKVSFDGRSTALEMARAAAAAGLKEICFTDHIDLDPLAEKQTMIFDTQEYLDAYSDLQVEGLIIRRGMEYGLLPDNQEAFREDLQRYPFDFVLGSVHFAENVDPYFPAYWQGKDQVTAERRYFEEILTCVQRHESYDVLGHLTYLGKTMSNPNKRAIPYIEYREVVDEILRTLAQKGKGMEVNTSGMGSCGAFLPTAEYLRRFKELGGQIVTVGSDAHDTLRVGQHCREAMQMLGEIFGYVCTFRGRQPVFHKI